MGMLHLRTPAVLTIGLLVRGNQRIVQPQSLELMRLRDLLSF